MAMQPVSLVVIDYIQIIVPERTTNRNTEVGEIARILQGLAKELNVPILALAQLNRAVDARQDKIPLLCVAGFGDTGAGNHRRVLVPGRLL